MDLSLSQLFFIFEQWLFLIKKWQINSESAHLNITGGEPLIRPDFFKFVEKISPYSHLFNFGLMTNGSLLNRNNISKLKKANMRKCQVSLEGMKENNDEIRGKGAFEKTVKAIKLLVDSGIETHVSLTLTKKNMKDVPALTDLCNSLGVFMLKTKRLVPWGRGKELKKYMLQPKELRGFYLKVKKINEKLWLSSKRRLFAVGIGCESGIFGHENPFNFSSLCGVTDGRCLTIMANGDVLPCRRLPIVAGNALKKDIFRIYYSEKMKTLRDLNNLHSFCRNCPNFVNCLGGAKCINYAYCGKWNVPDVQCWRAYDRLDEPMFT